MAKYAKIGNEYYTVGEGSKLQKISEQDIVGRRGTGGSLDLVRKEGGILDIDPAQLQIATEGMRFGDGPNDVARAGELIYGGGRLSLGGSVAYAPAGFTVQQALQQAPVNQDFNQYLKDTGQTYNAQTGQFSGSASVPNPNQAPAPQGQVGNRYIQFAGSPDIFDKATGRYISESEAKGAGIFGQNGQLIGVDVSQNPRPAVKSADQFAKYAGTSLSPEELGQFDGQLGGEPYTEPPQTSARSTEQLRNEFSKLGISSEDLEGVIEDGALGRVSAMYKQNNEIIQKIRDLAMPTGEEQQLTEDIQELEEILRNKVQGVEERSLDGTVLKSAIANEIQNITQGNTRESLVLLRRMDNLNRKLARLEGNRKAQFDALNLEYDLTRQSASDALNFYKLTQPDRVAIDEKRGIAYFQNPITNEVYASQMQGFEPEEGAQVTRDTLDNFYIDGRKIEQDEFQRLGINADFVPRGSSVTLEEAKTGKRDEGELEFETRTVGGRVKRFAFDKAGNLVRTEDLGSSSSSNRSSIVSEDIKAKNLLAAGIPPSAVSGDKLTKGNKDKVVATGVPPSIVFLITEAIIMGNTLDQIRTAISQDSPEGAEYLDNYISALSEDNDISNPWGQ